MCSEAANESAHDNQQTMEILLADRNWAIEEFFLLKSVNQPPHHLALNETQVIGHNEKKRSEINGAKFRPIPH